MCENDDILVVISDDDIPKLRDKYKQFFPRTAYVYNFLNCVIEWKKENRDKNYFTLMSPHGNWSSGTFVALQEWSGSDLFIATLDESYDLPYTVLTRTRKIQWNKLFVLYAVQKFNFPMVLKALQEVQFPIHHFNTYDVWWISKKLALELEIENCPTDVHIAELEPAHATVINSHWSSVFPGSDVYLTTFIKLNGGFGAFLKSDGTLVSWILKNQIGLGALQTLEAYKGNGYATLIVKHMARKIAEGNEDPLGTILQSNSQSQSLFKKLGFVIVETVVFVESEIIQ